MPEWGRIQLESLGWFRFDCGTIWLVYMDLDKSVYHLFLNTLTHNSQTCDSFVTRNWFIVQSGSPSVMHCQSPELAYLNTVIRDSLSRSRCEWQCITIVILMFTRPWVKPQIENCRNANFVITVVPANCHHNDNLGDDNAGVMTTFGFSAMAYQILDQYSLIPRYYLW